MKYPILHCIVIIAVLTASATSPAVAAVGDLYVADQGTGNILVFTPAGVKTVLASGFMQPVGLAFDRQGNLFVSDSGAGTITKISPAGVQSTFASDLGGGATGVAFDYSGNLYASAFNDGVVYRFTPDGTRTIYASGFTTPVGLAFDSNGTLFVSELTAGLVSSITPGGAKTPFASGLVNPAGLAFDGKGNLLVSDLGNGKIHQYTREGGDRILAAFPGAAGLAFDATGLLFATSYSGGTISKVASDGSLSPFASGLNSGALISFEPVVGKLRNLSARGFVETGEHVLVGGFIVGGNGLLDNKVLIRAIGPSLSAAGVGDALQDPMLELRDSSGVVVLSNDNWQDSQLTKIQTSGLAPTDPKESAILATLPAGAYTAIVSSSGSGTGTALLEVYEAP